MKQCVNTPPAHPTDVYVGRAKRTAPCPLWEHCARLARRILCGVAKHFPLSVAFGVFDRVRFFRIGAALAKVTWLCVRGLGRLTILRLPACVSTFEAYVESLRSREGLVRSVRTEEIFLERERIFSSVSDSRRETSGVRVFRPLASESETLDWSRKERSRVRIECRSACGNERWLRRSFSLRVLLR